jgi:hypothetical protein
MSIRNHTMALGLAGALALGATAAASAGPFPIGNAAVKDSASGKVTDIRWRGYGIGPGLGFGLAAGALVGAAVAAQPYYYGPGYSYGGPVYAEPYAYGAAPVYAPGYYGYGYAPGYYGNGYGYRCYTDEGYGRRRSCSSN